MKGHNMPADFRSTGPLPPNDSLTEAQNRAEIAAAAYIRGLIAAGMAQDDAVRIARDASTLSAKAWARVLAETAREKRDTFLDQALNEGDGAYRPWRY